MDRTHDSTFPFVKSFQQAYTRAEEKYGARRILLIFIPLSLTLFLPPPWLLFGFLLSPAYFLFRARTLGSPLPQTKINFPILLLLVGVVIGLWVSPARLSGVESAAKLLASLTTFYVLLDVLQTSADVWRAASALVLAGLAVVLLLPFSVGWSADKVFALPAFLDWTLRPPGQGTNPNIVGGMLAAILPLGLVLLAAPRRSERIVGAIALGPFLIALLVLQARAAWFALLGGLAIGATLYRRWFLPIIPLLLLGLLFLNQQLGGVEALSDTIFGKIGKPTSGTLQERVALWTQAVELIRAHPLTGIGMGAYPFVTPYAPPNSPSAPGLLAAHAHNVFLQVALDTGIFGLAGFVGVFVMAILSAWRAYTRQRAMPLPIGILTAFSVILLHSFADGIFWGLKTGWVLWFLFGIACVLPDIAEQE